MDKAEAIAVLREISKECPEIGIADFVSLDPHKLSVSSKGFYKITLRVTLDSRLKRLRSENLGCSEAENDRD
jgi:hypothetical protein